MLKARTVLLGLAVLALGGPALANPTTVSPSDNRIEYVGRFDWRDTAGPRCSWAGSSIAVAVSAPDLYVDIKDSAPFDYFEVVVDGQPASVLEVRSNQERYQVVSDLPGGPHRVELVKRTEPLVSTAQFLGFEVDGRVYRARPDTDRRIEIIGDSISCGFGNEAPSKSDNFSPATENNWLTYGAVAARAVDAEYTCIAWSGRKMWPDDTIPAVYDRALPGDATSPWQFNTPEPQAVLINLGTNDFRTGPPDETAWVNAYCDFIHHLRQHYRYAYVYCAVGSMMTDNWPPNGHYLTILRGYLQHVVKHMNASGDDRVAFLEFPEQQEADGIGAGYHPSVATHQKMANVLTAALHRDLGW